MSIIPRRRTPGRRLATLVPMAALAAVALLAAGCGSSGSSGSSSGSSSTGSSSSSVSAANQLLDKYTARPTSITQTTPIKKAIPTGKKITFISCGVEACAVQGPILQQGAKTLGWTVTQVGTDGSPEKVQNAIQAAVRNGDERDHPQRGGCDDAGEADRRRQGQGRGVRDLLLAGQAGQDVLFNTGTPEQNAPIGDILASKVVAQSGGKANTVYVNVSAFAILAAVGTEFEQEVQGALPELQVGEDRHPADVARQGRSGPHRVLPAQPPERELRGAVGVRLPRRRPPGRAARRRPQHQGEDRRPGRQPADLPGRQVRPGGRRRRRPRSTATTTRCSTRSRASGRASRSSRHHRSSGS